MSYTSPVGYNIGQADDLHLFDDAFRLQILKNKNERNGLFMISSSCVGIFLVCLGASIDLYAAGALTGRVLTGAGFSLILVIPSYYFSSFLYKCCNENDNNFVEDNLYAFS